ncbi:MAG: RCC1 domain-containing protein [Micrococcaceae bacterium]
MTTPEIARLILTSDNLLYSWGRDVQGQLGNGVSAGERADGIEATSVIMNHYLQGKTILKLSSSSPSRQDFFVITD